MPVTTKINRQIPIYMIAITVLAAILLSTNVAFCQISAEAELGYKNYDLKNNANQHLAANSFYQRYSLLYNTKGSILNERFANYNVTIGYDWSGFNTTIKSVTSESVDDGKGKITYRGDLTVDPREVPFKLHLYSYDMSRSSYFKGNRFNTSILNSQQIRGDMSTLSPDLDIPIGIMSGQHTNSGVTLIMGVKNGMTNGYNEVLRHFPMVMLDYKDVINKDNSSSFREDNRLSRLAFVSLNKKDNWFHYRHTTYNDFIDSSNSFVEKQIQIGTVDHLLQRRWIDFTNWLQVSADGQLTQHTSPAGKDSFEESNLNLYGTARRSTWEARMFNSWNRYKEENNTITYKTSIPLYASGLIGQDIRWDAYSTYKDNVTNLGEQFTTVNAGYRMDTFSRSLFTLNQSLGVEHSDKSDGSNSLLLSGSIGTISTNKYSRYVLLSGQYAINHNIDHLPTSNSTFTVQELNANVTYIASNTLTLSLSQKNSITNGHSNYVISSIAGSTNASQYYNPRTGSTNVSSTYRSVTTLETSWNPKPRLFVTLSIIEDIFKEQNANRSDISRFQNTIKYSTAAFTFSSVNSYANATAGELSVVSNQVSSENIAHYIFNKNLDSRLAVSYYKPFISSGASDTLSLYQALNYYYFKTNGVVRKLFEINESYESTGNMNNVIEQRRHNVSLGIKYYPIRQVILSSSATYAFSDNISDYQMSYRASAAANFSLLDGSLDYTYGKNKIDGRVEKIFSANLKKRF